MINYKGIFYREEKEKKFYEGGAHFKYSDLVNALIDLIKEQNQNLELEISKNSSKNAISPNNKNINIHNEEKKIKNSSKEKNNNSNLLTINNHPIKNNIKIITTHKYILNTEKNDIKENAKKKRLIELLNINSKISPFKNNHNNYKKVLTIGNNSINKNYKRKSLNTIGNNDNLHDSNNYLSIVINNNSKIKKMKINNNLPLIQSSYLNNITNKNMFDNNNIVKNDIKNNIINLKHISKINLNKTKISKDNLFLKNKMFSPDKNLNFKRNNAFSKDISEINKNQKKYDTINILTKKNRNFIGGKLSKYLNNMNKQKKNLNIKLLNFEYNKKEQ
jgi:hypothetical protein